MNTLEQVKKLVGRNKMKTCCKRAQRGDRFRRFSEFWLDLNEQEHFDEQPINASEEAWNYQQKYIDLLETKIANLRKGVK